MRAEQIARFCGPTATDHTSHQRYAVMIMAPQGHELRQIALAPRSNMWCDVLRVIVSALWTMPAPQTLLGPL
jgi:hypothetical protein